MNYIIYVSSYVRIYVMYVCSCIIMYDVSYQNWFNVCFVCWSVLGLEPSFDVPLVNVTVVSGQLAVLPCRIENLATRKVSGQLAVRPCRIENIGTRKVSGSELTGKQHSD